MLFSSLEFLYLFLPITVALYFLCPARARNVCLFVTSLIFYGYGEPIYIILMLFTVAVDYAFGLLIERSSARGGRCRVWLWSAVGVNLLLLGFFKYYGFVSSLLPLPRLDIKLPIGISFYTFQALSYVIDVYRRTVSAQRSFISFGTYVTLFPQLVAGPIVRYSDVDKSLSCREHSVSRTARGLVTFSAGLAKKVLLANGAGQMSETLLSGKSSVASLWLGLIFYAFQIYYDFSGYSDMAIGLGRIFGFDFPENFNYPYISRSITEFWRRWHITLSSWFREYVYFSLGGSRCSLLRTLFNLFVTWSLTGLWHGAAWNFILWGIYFFALIAIEKIFLLRVLQRLPHFVGHVYALVFILLGWLIFLSDGATLGEIPSSLASLFGADKSPILDRVFFYELFRNLPYIAIMAVGATPLPRRIYGYFGERAPRAQGAFRVAAALVACIVSTAYLVDSGYNPFLYFRF